MYLPVSWKQPVSWLTALPAMNGFSRGSSHDCSRGQSSRSDARQAGLDAATVCTLLAIFGVTTGARLDVLSLLNASNLGQPLGFAETVVCVCRL